MSKILKGIAIENELSLIATTPRYEGVDSRNCKYALIGFDTFEEAEVLAEMHNLDIEIFRIKDGQDIYERVDGLAYEAFEIDDDFYGDNYRCFTGDDLKHYYRNEVSERLGDFNSIDEALEFLNEQKDIVDELEAVGDNDVVVTCEGRFFEIVERRTMCWKHDTITKVIGVIEKDSDEFNN